MSIPEVVHELMLETTPAVSVIVPAYNGERTILRTISSIIRQDQASLELIVVDDGSKDSTSCLVDDFIKKAGFSGHYSLVRHEQNLGLSRSLNDAIQQCHAPYILILHQDCEFVSDNWVSRAVSLMKDESVAIVTGYYGLSDAEDETFVKRAFGVLRKQFHSRPEVSCEEATFSEGKCDLYRKDYLLKAGGFPTGYRIAGEDLIVSYTLRSIGYKILKCYDLPVIQRFTGAAESFNGNLGKEFLFGKVMGGVFSKFKLFLFKGAKNSLYSGSRSLHRASQPIFVFALVFSVIASLFLVWWFLLIACTLFLFRVFYYIERVYKELQVYQNRVRYMKIECVGIALIGVLTDIAYTLGFTYGLAMHELGRRL
jgi:glycosyltransferase involved in cell wall biosynthesis